MTREEHKQAVQSILGMIASEHQADASEILTNLTEDYEETLTSLETANDNVSTLTTNNEKLRKVNADLFLKVGTPVKNPTEKHEEFKEEKPLPFTDLFDEKGELK